MYDFGLLIAEKYMQLVYVLLPWLFLSLIGSYFLNKFGEVDLRNKIGKTLRLGSLCYEQNDKEFLMACKDGNAALVESMLKLSDSSVLNQTDNQENCEKTGLNLACENDKIEVVKLLVKDPNININVKDNKGYSAFVYCKNKNELVARELLECGKLNIQDDRKFAKACQFGSVALVESMLKLLDNSVLKQSEGLHLACYNNCLEVVKLLVEDPNIDINVKDSKGKNAMFYCEKEQIARVLLQSGRLNIQNGLEFVKACEFGSVAHVESLFKLLDMSALNLSKGLPSDNECSEEVKLQVEDPNMDITIRVNGLNALSHLIGKHEQLASVLLESGIFKIQDAGGEFLKACAVGNLTLVKLMLQLSDSKILNYASPGSWMKTGLHLACENGRLEVVKHLVEHPDININATERGGYSALEYCMHNNSHDKQVAKVLLESEKFDISQMRKKFRDKGDGSIQFDYQKWSDQGSGIRYRIKMNTVPRSVRSIKKI